MDPEVLKIVKSEIPFRKVEFRGKVIITTIFFLIALFFQSSVFAVVGALFFLFFYWVYKEGSIYTTFKVMKRSYDRVKISEGGNNKEILEKTIVIRISSPPKPSDPSSYYQRILLEIDELVMSGVLDYSYEDFLIYVASCNCFMLDNNLEQDESYYIYREFYNSQVKRLSNIYI